MEYIKADNEICQSILDLTKSLLEKCGSRLPGTKGSRLAADEISQIM
jgi:hypothetical protein